MLKSKIDFKKKIRAIDENHLETFGNELKAEIISRTQSGKDINKNAFKPYSNKYKKEKQKDFGSSTVNLTRTQQMLNAIDNKKIPNGIRLFFNSTQQNEKAYFNQTVNKRNFFGFDNSYLEKLGKKLAKIIFNKIK